jgi:hypothetical protein
LTITQSIRIADEATTRAARPVVEGTVPGDPETSGRSYTAEILLISFAALLLEISYTRIVSYKLFYYYTYLVIGLALLGIGSGGVLVTVSGRLRRAATDTIMMWGLLLGAASVGLGYVVVARTPIDTLRIWDYDAGATLSNSARLVLICLALFASFVAVGVMIATLFGRRSEQIGRLYFADLLGAGLACAVVVALISSIGPPATIVLAGLILALAGLRIAVRRRSRAITLGGMLAVLLAVGVVAPSVLPHPREDASKTNLSNVEFSSWSPIFRVDAAPWKGRLLLYHDALLGSNIFAFNGDVSTLTRYDSDPRSFPFTLRDKAPGNVMIIGAAGGNEILASLRFKAGHIDAIELNPVTYRLVTDKYEDYAGHLNDIPNVNYVNGDGRSYLARSDKTYDLVWFPATDSYAASNAATAGAYVLSESYLYTSDAIVDSLERTGQDGILASQFGEFSFETKPNRTSRYVSTARHALARLGVDDPSRHILVGTTASPEGGSLSTILVKRSPFTPAEIERFVAQQGAVPNSTLRYAAGQPPQPNSVTAIATLPKAQLNRWYDSYAFDVGPVTDDGPFFWHFDRFGDVIRDFGSARVPWDLEDATGERVLLVLLGIALLFSAVFLLLPVVAIRKTWTQLPRKGRSALYFACLGLGFMFFEITLIQRLTLFLGYPTYSLTVTLASILIFTGVGALLSGRHKHRPRVLQALVAVIVALTLFYQFGLPPLTDGLLTLPLVARMLIAFVVLAPLGICLGTFMPLGLGAVADLTEFPREYVAWGWAVNGFASVVGAVLTTILAMTFGFRVVLFLALLVYLVALLALRGLLRTSRGLSSTVA